MPVLNWYGDLRFALRTRIANTTVRRTGSHSQVASHSPGVLYCALQQMAALTSPPRPSAQLPIRQGIRMTITTPIEHGTHDPDPLLSPLHLRIRPSGRADRERLDRCFRTLSPESSRLRFFATKRALSDKELDFFSGADGSDHIALAAIRLDDKGQEQEALGFVRCVRLTPGGPCAEFSITVLDAEQGRGLGSALADAVMKAAATAGIRQLCFEVLADNMPMRKLAHHMGGHPRRMEDGTLEYDCALTPAPAPILAAVAAASPTLTPFNPGWILPWFADPRSLVGAWLQGVDATLVLAQRAQTDLCRSWGLRSPWNITPGAV